MTNVWSTTKTMTFLCALDPGRSQQLDFHAPVATYWPEFAAGGKEAVEVRHLMGHTAGLSRLGGADRRRASWPTGRSAPACWPPRRRGGSPGRPRATTP